MNRRWWITAPLAWAGVVAVVALVAWWVIDDAGEIVVTQPAREVVTPPPGASDPTAAGSPTTDGRGPRSPRVSPSAPTGGPTGTPPPTSAPPPTAPATTGEEPRQPTAVRRTSTWQGPEGLLRVSCTGPDLQLDGATPQDGYEIDKNERRSGSELEVRFRSIDGDRRVEIGVRCIDGTPAFVVERDD